MRLLLNHCIPRRWRRLLPGHEVRTVYEQGWADLNNGALLARAAGAFDRLITVDRGLEFQQHLTALPIGVIGLRAGSNRFATLAPYAPWALAAIEQVAPPALVRIDGTGRIEVVQRPSA